MVSQTAEGVRLGHLHELGHQRPCEQWPWRCGLNCPCTTRSGCFQCKTPPTGAQARPSDYAYDSGFESEIPAKSAVELDDSAHRLHCDRVGHAVGFEHADEIAGAGDLHAQALAEGFAPGPVTEVVLAAGASGLRNDLDLARVALECHHRLPLRVKLPDVERFPIGAARV